MNNNKLGTILILGIILLSGLVFVPSTVGQSETCDGFDWIDTFDTGLDVTPGNAPTGCFYDSPGSGRVSTIQSVSSPHSVRLAAVSGSVTDTYEFNNSFCDAVGIQSVEFDWRTDSLAQAHSFASGSTSSANSFSFTVAQTTGIITMSQRPDSGSATTTTHPSVITINTWYHIIMSLDCPNSDYVLSVDGITENLGSSGWQVDNVNMNDLRVGISNTGPISFLDNLELHLPNVVEADAIFNSANTITGFDYEINGATVAIMTQTLGDVTYLNGEVLTTIDTSASGCSPTTYGKTLVALDDDGYSWLDCPISSSDVEEIHYVSTLGNDYPFDEDCTSCDGAIEFDDITVESDFTIMDTVLPSSEDTEFETAQAQLFYYGVGAISTGKVYLLTTYFEDDGLEITNVDELTYATATNGPTDLCSNHNVSRLRFYATNPGIQTKEYAVTIHSGSGLTAQAWVESKGSFEQTSFNVAALNQADRIACSQNLVLVAETGGTDSITLWDTQNNALVWTQNVLAADVALSDDGEWAMYSSSIDDISYFMDADTGEIICRFTHPDTDSVVATGIDQFGQRAWVVQTDSVAYYSVQAQGCSTENPVGEGGQTTTSTTSSSTNTGCLGCTALPSTGPGSRPFGIDINYVAQGLNISAIGVQVLIGLILMVVFFIWMYRGSGGSIIAGILGSGLGLAVATIIGLVPPWVVMAVVLALLIILGKMIYGGFSGGEES